MNKNTLPKAMRSSACIYCGHPDAPTMDHVPPRAIFPPNLPSTILMVTAPACQRCHDANMTDDATIRNILVSTQDTEKHPAIVSGLAGKRDRSLNRNDGDFRKLLESMKLVNVGSASGSGCRPEWAFDFESPIMNRFVERLSRAILSYEFHQPFFKGVFDWRVNVEIPPVVYDGIRSHGRLREVCDVFAYGVTELKGDGPSWVLANIYGTVKFFVRIAKS